MVSANTLQCLGAKFCLSAETRLGAPKVVCIQIEGLKHFGEGLYSANILPSIVKVLIDGCYRSQKRTFIQYKNMINCIVSVINGFMELISCQDKAY